MKSKILNVLISVAIALAVWFYVVTIVSPNSDKSFYDIKVEPVGERILNEQGLMITNMDELSTVTLHLEGSRVDLNKLSSDNINVSMDVSKISEPGNHALSYSISYPGDVAQNAFTVLSKDPGSVKVIVEERISKTVPVDVKYLNEPDTGYVAEKENATLDVENVTVTGPKPVIDKIHMAQIEVDLKERNKSFRESFTYTLCSENGAPVDAQMVITDVAEVNLELRVVQVKEIKLDVTVNSGGGITREDCTVVIEPPIIEVTGSDSLLADLNTLILGTVELGQITETTTITYPIKLPEEVTNKTGITEAKVTITLPELETKTLKIKNIKVENAPAGSTVKLVTKELEVIFRGPKDALNALTEDNVTVIVDCNGLQKGIQDVEPTVSCSDNAVGAMNVQKVTVTIE